MGDLNYRLEAKKAWVEGLVTLADLMRREAALVEGRSAKINALSELNISQISLEGVSSVLSADELDRGLLVLNLLRVMGICKDAPAPKDPAPHPPAAQGAAAAPDGAGAAAAPTRPISISTSSAAVAAAASAASSEAGEAVPSAAPPGPSEEEVRYVEAAIAKVKADWTEANPDSVSHPE
jgi:hypothetical protein